MPTGRTVHAIFDQRNEAARARLSHPYHARRTVLSTQHDKFTLVAPPLELHVAVDTNQRGSFTGDITRTGSPWNTAVATARLDKRGAHCPIGIASEGSIGPHPSAPFVNVSVDDDIDDLLEHGRFPAEAMTIRPADGPTSHCPERNTPGWATVLLDDGLPCGHCGDEVSIARADVLGCATGPATRTVHRGQVVADPARCDWCNP